MLVVLGTVLSSVPTTGQPDPKEVRTTEAMDADRDSIFDALDDKLENKTDDDAVRAIVTLNTDATDDAIAALKRKAGSFDVTSNRDANGIGHGWTLLPAFAAKLTKKQLLQLAALPEVRQVEEDLPLQTSTDYQSYQTLSGVQKVRDDFHYSGDANGDDTFAPGGHQYSASDVVACVLDTGIDPTHPDLNENQVLLFNDFLNVSVNATINVSQLNISIYGVVNLTVNASASATFTGTLNGASFDGGLNGAVVGTLVGTLQGTLNGSLQGELNATIHYNTAYDSLTWPHGTWVSGVLAGQGDMTYSAGLHATGAPYPGIANGTALVVGRVNENPVLQTATAAALINGFQWCADHREDYGVRIISFSGGLLANPSPYECPDGSDAASDAANRAWDRNITVVIAAANLGSGHCTVTSPGVAKNVITVGAMNDPLNAATDGACTEDALQTKGWYLWPSSSRGHALNATTNGTVNTGAVKPELVAPGVCITMPSPLGIQNCALGSGFCTASGTSLSTPFVAGTVALMRHGNSSLTPNETKRFLMQTAEPWGPSLYAYPVPANYDYGAGRLQVFAAVNASGSTHFSGSVSNPQHWAKIRQIQPPTVSETWRAMPTDRTWWIAATLIVPGLTEGGQGIAATLQIGAVGGVGCALPSTNVTSPREAQVSYNVGGGCTATSFDITVTLASVPLAATPYWLDVTYGGPDLT